MNEGCKAEIIVNRISSKFFSYNEKENSLSAFASDIPITEGRPISNPFLSQVWSGSSSSAVGFVMNSHKTGRDMIFVLDEVVREFNCIDGDIRCWSFKNHCPEDGNLHKKITCVIFND